MHSNHDFFRLAGRRLLGLLAALAAGSVGIADDKQELLRLLRQEEAYGPISQRVPGKAPSTSARAAQESPQIRTSSASPRPPISRVRSASPIAPEKIEINPAERRVKPKKSPSWLTSYTIGPGDTINIAMYNRPDLFRESVPVGPDGTVSYLQAIGVRVEGLSLDEVGEKIQSEIRDYHPRAKVFVTPAELGSKQIAVIGQVKEPGKFALDRPTTILEAIAGARGIQVGQVSGSAFELADLERSFVGRDGGKLDVDLSKLYFQGDFSQNAQLEPNDYIFIASSLRNEYYILGAVSDPGRRKMPTKLTVLRAITDAGGFTKEAYKMHVLLVRGSIHNPTTEVINVRDILTGKKADIPIQNRDILYVHKRPFHIAEDAVDSAIVTFVQTVAAEVVNQNYNPLSIGAGD